MLDHTAVSAGSAGRRFGNESTLELRHATEFQRSQPGEWPLPTAFVTRNIGHSLTGSAVVEALQAKMEFIRMMPHRSWDALAEKTREPGDIFLPHFRTIDITQTPSATDKAARPVADPFAEPAPPADPAPPDLGPSYAPERIHLAARANEDLPEPKGNASPDGADSRAGASEMPGGKSGDARIRLIFFRGVVGDPEGDTAPPIAGNYQLSARFVRVDHRMFSDWVQRTAVRDIPAAAWTAVDEWKKAGKAKIVGALTGTHRAGAKTTLEDTVEVIYPTEWDPGSRTREPDGKLAEVEFSTGTAYETKQSGTTVESELIAGPRWPLLKFSIERVVHGGESVHYRIPRGGKWMADVKFPLFTSNRWSSTVRVDRGKWILVGSGADIDASGKFAADRVVLAFIKVE